ncbi:MAG TPA: hypothetical protein DDX54_00130 [Rhodospirillaceae bacterium]|jgi:hypothetical protein|nr:hypothetical protein [Alphaproteobacteria bacterium]HBH25801.1 hypothetical protein [Rhodospirillaceae bacterium]
MSSLPYDPRVHVPPRAAGAALGDCILAWLLVWALYAVLDPAGLARVPLDALSVAANITEHLSVHGLLWWAILGGLYTGIRLAGVLSPWGQTPGMALSGLTLKAAPQWRRAAYVFVGLAPFAAAAAYLWAHSPFYSALEDMCNALGLAILTALLMGLPARTTPSRRSVAERVAGVTLALTPGLIARLERWAASPWRRWLNPRPRFHVAYWLVLAVTLFLTFQVLREPPLDPAYEEVVYASRGADWGPDNGYFALNGLNAPEGVADTYAWGRGHAPAEARNIETLKARAGIRVAWPLPPEEGAAPEEGEKVAFAHGDKKLDCLYDPKWEDHTDCATAGEARAAVAANPVLWARFGRLPDYPVFAPVLTIGGQMQGRDVINLAKLKTVTIVLDARARRGEAAVREWVRFMHLYRRMLGAPDTMVGKAIFMVCLSRHLTAYEALLAAAPGAVAAQEGAVLAALEPQSPAQMFRADRMFADDLAAVEPLVLPWIGHAATPRNGMLACLRESAERARLPASAFTPALGPACTAIEGAMPHALWAKPGNPVVNAILYLLYGGLLQGREVVANMHAMDAHLRAATLATQAVARGVAGADMPAFLAAAPEGLHNPFTGAPFTWDAAARAITWHRPGREEAVHFALPAPWTNGAKAGT